MIYAQDISESPMKGYMAVIDVTLEIYWYDPKNYFESIFQKFVKNQGQIQLIYTFLCEQKFIKYHVVYIILTIEGVDNKFHFEILDIT